MLVLTYAQSKNKEHPSKFQSQKWKCWDENESHPKFWSRSVPATHTDLYQLPFQFSRGGRKLCLTEHWQGLLSFWAKAPSCYCHKQLGWTAQQEINLIFCIFRINIILLLKVQLFSQSLLAVKTKWGFFGFFLCITFTLPKPHSVLFSGLQYTECGYNSSL